MSEVHLRVRRRIAPSKPAYWEEFRLPRRPGQNVIGLLLEIQRQPVNAQGEETTPVVYEASCLEEVCGSCAMLINGRVRQACSTLVSELGETITLEPLSAFPVVRDLVVDRSVLFENLKKVRAWVSIDGTHDLGPTPPLSPTVQEEAYPLSRCIMCGACAEACPNFGPHSPFVGAFALNQVRLLNAHATGQFQAQERLQAIMGEGGIQDCGNAQNCVRVCPKGIPLATSIAALNRAVLRQGLANLLGQ